MGFTLNCNLDFYLRFYCNFEGYRSLWLIEHLKDDYYINCDVVFFLLWFYFKRDI